jgi:hypothetical protein
MRSSTGPLCANVGLAKEANKMHRLATIEFEACFMMVQGHR